MTDKKAEYAALIEKRKTRKFPDGLTNPKDTDFDGNYLEPWSQWQGNLDASIVVVGQDFCDTDTFHCTRGTVERYDKKYEFPTNRNLAVYFKEIGISLDHPRDPNRRHVVFFTNALMGLKPPPMNSALRPDWLEFSRTEFLQPLLVDVIKPKVIIALGKLSTSTIGDIYGFKMSKNFGAMVSAPPISLQGSPLIFPVYHTGSNSRMNRPIADQVDDWKRIKASL